MDGAVSCRHETTHKFRVGDKIQFLAGLGVRATAEVYEIVQQLPERDGEYHYKIKFS
jgi:hypothetical protein